MILDKNKFNFLLESKIYSELIDINSIVLHLITNDKKKYFFSIGGDVFLIKPNISTKFWKTGTVNFSCSDIIGKKILSFQLTKFCDLKISFENGLDLYLVNDRNYLESFVVFTPNSFLVIGKNTVSDSEVDSFSIPNIE